MSDRIAERVKAVDRLRSLLAMTVENGCTEAEAARAREAAERIRARYEITDDELSATVADEADDDSVFIQARPYPSPNNARHLHPLIRVIGHKVSDYFRCRSFYSGVDLILIGDEVDVVAAHRFLADAVEATAFHLEGFKRYVRTHDDIDLHPRTIASEFQKGMGTRLYARLDEHVSQMQPAQGQDMVVSSSDKLDEIMAEVTPHLSSKKARFRSETTWAFECGWIAGAHLRLPGEEGDDEPIDWAEELASVLAPIDDGEPRPGPHWQAPKRRAMRRALTRFLDDSKWSTGWAFHRVGWTLTLPAIAAFLIDPGSSGAVSKALGIDLGNIAFVGLVMILAGEALGGDGPRPQRE